MTTKLLSHNYFVFYEYFLNFALFLQQIHASEKDFVAASSLLGVGMDYAHISNACYTKILFLLSRCMLLLIDKKFSEVNQLLSNAGHLVENWQGNTHQKEYLKVYFLVLQVCYYLMAGQVKRRINCAQVFFLASRLLVLFLFYR